MLTPAVANGASEMLLIFATVGTETEDAPSALVSEEITDTVGMDAATPELGAAEDSARIKGMGVSATGWALVELEPDMTVVACSP